MKELNITTYDLENVAVFSAKSVTLESHAETRVAISTEASKSELKKLKAKSAISERLLTVVSDSIEFDNDTAYIIVKNNTSFDFEMFPGDLIATLKY